MKQNAQDAFLSRYRDSKEKVVIYLENGIRLNACQIEDFDDVVVVVHCHLGHQMIYKTAMSTVLEWSQRMEDEQRDYHNSRVRR